jgi:hypothetical protein
MCVYNDLGDTGEMNLVFRATRTTARTAASSSLGKLTVYIVNDAGKTFQRILAVP